MKVRECMKLVEGEKNLIVAVDHIFFDEYETQDGRMRKEYKSKTIVHSLAELTEEIMEKECTRCYISTVRGKLPPSIQITLPWEDGLVADYWDVKEREMDGEYDDEEIA